jgi:hypothetical protein
LKVLVLSADVGEGHAAAATNLAAELRAQADREVSVVDGVSPVGASLAELVCEVRVHPAGGAAHP